jgi:hypothetical protein
MVGPWFRTNRGMRQGDPISPTVFIAILERAMDKIKNEAKGISVQGMNINNLRFADDVDILEEDATRLELTTQMLSDEAKKYGLFMNFDKTKTMIFGDKDLTHRVMVDGEQLENVERFTYLGSNMTYDLDCKSEIKIRIAKGTAALKGLDTIWKSRAINIKTKIAVLKACVFSSMMYGCETWILTKDSQRRILSFERKCYRKTLRIGWTQRVSNEELYKRINLKENLMQKVIQRKLGLFGHFCRMRDDRKIKSLVFGIMEGANKRGRPHREWTDDIEEWCGADLQKLGHLAQNRLDWRDIVKRASDTYGH